MIHLLLLLFFFFIQCLASICLFRLILYMSSHICLRSINLAGLFLSYVKKETHQSKLYDDKNRRIVFPLARKRRKKNAILFFLLIHQCLSFVCLTRSYMPFDIDHISININTVDIISTSLSEVEVDGIPRAKYQTMQSSLFLLLEVFSSY